MSEDKDELRHYVPKPEDVSQEYIELYDPFNKRAVTTDKDWDRVIKLAKEEEKTRVSKLGHYGNIPLQSMLELAERVRGEDNEIKRYEMITEKSPNGKSWFDVLLGLTSQEVISSIRNKIKDSTWISALDIGTGTGITARAISKNCREIRALDQSKIVLKLAKLRSDSKIRYTVADALHIPYPESFFDLAMSTGLTASFRRNELDTYIKELRRILIPGGLYIEAFPMRPGDEELAPHELKSLANAKGILADMIVGAVSGKARVKPEEQVDLKEQVQMFMEHGFLPEITIDKTHGTAVAEFYKETPAFAS